MKGVASITDKTRAGREASTVAVGEFAAATYRQVDYWCRRGLLDDGTGGYGSGSVRRFEPVEFEVAAALVAMMRIGLSRVSPDYIDRAAAVVRARRVDPAGEVLVCRLDGRVQRFAHWCAEVGDGDVAVIQLRPYPPALPAIAIAAGPGTRARGSTASSAGPAAIGAAGRSSATSAAGEESPAPRRRPAVPPSP